MIRWLRADLVRFRLAERQWAIKRHHAIVISAIVAALIVIFAAGVFVGFHYPYKVKPRPPLPAGQTAPAPSSPQCSGTQHVMGGCLPKPKVENQALITATRQGPDFSNNNPVSCSQVAAIAARNAFVELKVNQGTYYRDGTAAGMAACARSHGLVAGGYDFLDVCRSSPQAEAHFFYALLIADRLVGKGTLPPTGDAEYPTGSLGCNGRAWVAAWIVEIHVLSGRWPMMYTGAWWWQPHIGCWWYGGTIAWISGYGVRYPYMPCGRSQLDIWQFSDHGWNGATTSDLSVWRDSASSFVTLTSSKPPPPPNPYALFPTTVFALAAGVHASERNTVSTWDRSKCLNPVRRPVCKSSRYHLRLLRDREWFVAHHHLVGGRWVTVTPARWAFPKGQPLGLRFQQIEHRLTR